MSSGSPKPIEPIVSMVVNGVIREAYCSACYGNLGLGDERGTQEEQQANLEEAFQRHLRSNHPEAFV